VLNSSVANAVFFSELSTRYVSSSIFGADADNDCICQFGLSPSLAISVPLLRATVGSVVGIGSEEKVVWSHARRIVAGMEDVHSDRNVAEMKFPANSGSATGFPQLPIPVSGFCAGPQPTSRRLFNLCPEPFGQRSALAYREAPVSADDAAAEAAAFTDISRVNRKGGPAHHASAINHTGSYHG
jgi:hypothetical protein